MEQEKNIVAQLTAISNDTSIIISDELRELCKNAVDLIERQGAELRHRQARDSEPQCALKDFEKVSMERDQAYAAIRSIERNLRYPLENKPCSVCRYIGLYCSSGGASCKGFKWIGFPVEMAQDHQK